MTGPTRPRVLALYGTPCAVCFCPALEVTFYTDAQVVQHVDGKAACRIVAAPASTPVGPKMPARRGCRWCGRMVAVLRSGQLRLHRVHNGGPICTPPRRRRPIVDVHLPPLVESPQGVAP